MNPVYFKQLHKLYNKNDYVTKTATLLTPPQTQDIGKVSKNTLIGYMVAYSF